MQTDPSSKKKPLIFVAIAICLALLISFFIYWIIESHRYVTTRDASVEGYYVTLSPDIEARIVELYVDEGDFVKRGQLICSLDPSILESKKAQALANISYLQKKIHFYEIELAKLTDNYVIAKKEFEKEIISFIDYDHKEKDYQMGLSQVEVAKAHLEKGKKQLGVIEEILRHTRVYAPRDGMIAKRWVLSGDVAKIGQPVFFSI